MEMTDRFERASEHFRDLVHQIGADQWGARTPCSDWDVRALVNHLAYEARWVPPLLKGETIEQVGSRFDGDLLGADPLTSFDEALDAAAAAIKAPGALEQTVHLSFGDTPAMGYLAQMTGDFLIHSWDLARAIGADETLDPELVSWADAETRPNAAMLAQSGLFDPPVDVPDDADPQTKLLALFGRRR